MRLPLLALWAVLVGTATSLAAPPTYSAVDLQNSLRQSHPSLSEAMELRETSYAPIPATWLRYEFFPAFEQLVFDLRLRFMEEGFDCDNFALLFLAQLRLQRFLDHSLDSPVAGGLMTVNQDRGFGSISRQRGVVHAVVLLLTDEGWWVIEPQGPMAVPLSDYPNRNSTRRAYF